MAMRGGCGCTSLRQEEMNKLQDILPFPIALDRETKERERGEMESERINLSSHVTTVDICVVEKNTWTT
jgi:hypothetical protein